MRTPHIVLLSEQAVAILERIKEISGEYELVFPGDHNPYKPMRAKHGQQGAAPDGIRSKRTFVATDSEQWHGAP